MYFQFDFKLVRNELLSEYKMNLKEDTIKEAFKYYNNIIDDNFHSDVCNNGPNITSSKNDMYQEYKS